MIQLTRSGIVVSGAGAHLEQLRGAFRDEHYVRLRNFLEPELLRFVQSRIERAEFVERVHSHRHDALAPPEDATTWARDVTIKADLAQGLFDLLLMNDPNLFEWIQLITGCDRVGHFDGSVYQIDPALEHYDSWHDDVGHSRMVAISINLSALVYAGGVLQIREAASGVILSEVPNPHAGDAVLFRVSPQLQHRVSKVVGSAPRTAFAGWFCAQPVFNFHSAVLSDEVVDISEHGISHSR